MNLTMPDSPSRDPRYPAQTKPNTPPFFQWNHLPDEVQLDIIKFCFDGETLCAHARALSDVTSGGLEGHRHTYDTNLSVSLLLVSRRTKEMVRDMLEKYVHLTLDARRVKWGFYPSDILKGRPWWEMPGLTVLAIRDLILESLDDLPSTSYKRDLVNLERIKVTRTHKLFGTIANGNFGSIPATDLANILQDDNALLKAEILRSVAASNNGFELQNSGYTVLYLTVSVVLEFSLNDYESYEIPSHQVVSSTSVLLQFVGGA